MDASYLKERIIEDDNVDLILTELGCHKISKKNEQVRCALPDGNNPTSVQIYKDTLAVTIYTRDDFPKKADIITLVEYINEIYFVNAMNWICEVCGYDYYESYKLEQNSVDPCISILKEIEPNAHTHIDEIELKKYPESILQEYRQVPNIWFYHDGIDYWVQELFELGLSYRDDRITMPIRDEIGNLVGVKGRTILDLTGAISSCDNWKDIPKYNYVYKCPKNQILFGLYFALKHILEKKEVIVFESEKAVMQAWSMGYLNCISIGGHDFSATQVLKLERLGVDVVISFDKDIEPEELKKQSDKFITTNDVSMILDKGDLLGRQVYVKKRTKKGKVIKKPTNKTSPTDKGKEIFDRLYKDFKYNIN